MNRGVRIEITPLSEKDCFNIVDCRRDSFTEPLHTHREYELSFLENARGLSRIVGDSIEETGYYDLVLICNEHLEHTWQSHDGGLDIRQISIKFAPDLIGHNMLGKNQFSALNRMFRDAEHGIVFPLKAVMQVYVVLNSIPGMKKKFRQFLTILGMLNGLAYTDYRMLSSCSFSSADRHFESRRVEKVKQYINGHYSDIIKLNDMAELVNMSPTSFSRFFRQRAGMTLSQYLMDVRIGMAARALVDTTLNIAEICYSCGFNSLANFNRIFKAKKGMTPKEFRITYKKYRTMI